MITDVDGRRACDLCGRAGLPSRAYTALAGGLVHLCRSCARCYAGETPVSLGGHTVRFHRDGPPWRCDCGIAFQPPADVPGWVLDVVPDIVGATARIHLDRVAEDDRISFWSDEAAPDY